MTFQVSQRISTVVLKMLPGNISLQTLHSVRHTQHLRNRRCLVDVISGVTPWAAITEKKRIFHPGPPFSSQRAVSLLEGQGFTGNFVPIICLLLDV